MSENQKSFDNLPIIEEKKVEYYSCKYHVYAWRKEDFVEITIKKTGHKVIRCRYCERAKQENKKILAQEWKHEKENVTDYYVRRVLKTGRHGLKTDDIPAQLIEAKRAVIKLKNLTAELEKPLKTCEIHGNLSEAEVIKAGKRKNGEQTYKCKLCYKLTRQRHYEENKEKIRLQHKKYRNENRQKIRETKKRSYNKRFVEKIMESKIQRYIALNKIKAGKYPRISTEADLLTDSYVRRNIAKRSGLTTKDIPDALVACKRALLELRRAVKKTNENHLLTLLEGKLDVKGTKKY